MQKSRHAEQNRIALIGFLAPFEILPVHQPATSHYGVIRHALEQLGTVIGPMDMLIAATALAANLVLVTNNLREFDRVPGLATEDWSR